VNETEARKRSAETESKTEKPKKQKLENEDRGRGLVAPWNKYFNDNANTVQGVRSVYQSILGGGSTMPSASALQSLEFHGYLEEILIDAFSEDALEDPPYVCSLLLILNEKFQQSLPTWESVTKHEGMFERLFQSLVRLLQAKKLNRIESFIAVRFISNAVQSLEDPIVRVQVMKFFGIAMWIELPEERRLIQLQSRPELMKKWKHLLKKDGKLKKDNPKDSIFDRIEARFFPWLLEESLSCFDVCFTTENFDSSQDMLRFVEATLDLCVDVLSQLPTRRFAATFVKRSNFLLKIEHSGSFQKDDAKSVRSSVRKIWAVLDSSIDNLTGEVLTPEDAMTMHYQYAEQLERLLFKYWDSLRDVSFLSARELSSPERMKKYLSRLSEKEIDDLVCSQLKLATSEDSRKYGRHFLEAIFRRELQLKSTSKDFIEELPIYPTEKLITDPAIVPEDRAEVLDAIHGLPKINLQFLSLPDYFERNFKLYLAEVAYDVRRDLVNVVRRLSPFTDDTGRTSFSGWSKMAADIEDFHMIEVRPPSVGWNFPSYITGEFSINTSGMQSRVKDEWDQLREHDLLLLVSFNDNIGNEKRPQSDLDYLKQTIKSVRGCEIRQLCDEEGNKMNSYNDDGEWVGEGKGTKRTITIEFDPIQYHQDDKGSQGSLYKSFSIAIRRNSKENNFKSVLKSIRDALMSETTTGSILPRWLTDTFLGYGDPADATFLGISSPLRHEIDFQDTFLSADHVKESFPKHSIDFKGKDPPFKATFCSANSLQVACGMDPEDENEECKIIISSIKNDMKQSNLTNDVRFTPMQVCAITRSLQPGMSLIVGPPGSGKTDTAVQILHTLYHNNKNERTLIITHSNQALNDIFQKLSRKDIDIAEMLRLGYGENLLETDEEYDKLGRVNAMLERRMQLLQEIMQLSESIGVNQLGDLTCETSFGFWKMHILPRWERYQSDYKECKDSKLRIENFPFHKYLEAKDFKVTDVSMLDIAFRKISAVFDELQGLRPFEVLTSQRDRVRYMLTKQAKVIAMTCTHAAIKRQEFLDLGFSFDNVLMEEAAQVLDIESILPITMQQNKDGNSRLKRIIMIGDHHQLPPVVTNPLLKKKCRFEQSLFSRLIRLNSPYMQLDAQGRSRAAIANLYSWRYKSLRNLDIVNEGPYRFANPGFAFDYQFIDVQDFLGRGEYQPSPYFYQNLGEAEYIVLVYQYMRLLGYKAKSISILTTYNGQCELLKDVFRQKCANHPFFGNPGSISTVDKYQGQQNDHVLLSLVRTLNIGHLRDVRRLVVALSRARLGLYVFGRQELFQQCQELGPAMEQFKQRPEQLALVDGEYVGMENPRLVSNIPGSSVLVQDIHHMANIIKNMEADWRKKNGIPS